MIPRVVHHVWFGEPPDWVAKILDECRAANPGWEVVLWNQVPEDMPTSLRRRAHRCHQWCQLADIVYVWLLFSRGGVVCDCDSLALRSFDPLCTHEAFTSEHDARDHRLANGFMGSAPGSRAFAAALESIIMEDPPLDRGRLARCAYGPMLFTRLFHVQRRPGMAILPFAYFYPFSFAERSEAHRVFAARPQDRAGLLAEAAARHGIEPFAVHMWGVDGSSVRAIDREGADRHLVA